MVAVADVVDALGGGLLRTLVPAPGVAVTDVVIAEPGDAAAELRRSVAGSPCWSWTTRPRSFTRSA